MSIDASESRRRSAIAEEIERQKMLKQTGATELNRLLSYAILNKKRALLHVAPAKTIPPAKQLRLAREGLGKLAGIVKQNPRIKEVYGSSRIVEKNPRIAEMLGFTVQDLPKTQLMMHNTAQLFSREKSSPGREALMSREDFLKRYSSDSENERRNSVEVGRSTAPGHQGADKFRPVSNSYGKPSQSLQSGETAEGRGTRYPSWKERQKQSIDQTTKDAKRTHTRSRQAATKRTQVKQLASGAMSPITGYALIALGAFDDILDLGTGFLPGVTTILQFASATVQIIIILLDPGLRKVAWGERLKLFLKRWLIIAGAAAIEGIALGFNLLPLMTIAAFIARYMKSKATRRR